MSADFLFVLISVLSIALMYYIWQDEKHKRHLQASNDGQLKLEHEHRQLQNDHAKLHIDHEQLGQRYEQLHRDHVQLSRTHDQIKTAWRASWALVFHLIAERERLSQQLNRQREERTSLKRDLVTSTRADAEHRELWKGEQRKVGVLLALIIDFQAELSTLRAFQFRTRAGVVEEFIRKLSELIGGWKPTP